MVRSLQGFIVDDGLGRGSSEPRVIPYGNGGYAVVRTNAFGDTKALTSCPYPDPIGADIDLEMIKNGMMVPLRCK
ncbi:hypothetical protein HYT24_02160 [Candidatus Pacearchaeota archaeon]|nr:hypothetical protein [Candidatus Pacearchaeota archaeon]